MAAAFLASFHGPCPNCGLAFTSGTTMVDPPCPNCGVRGELDE